MNGDVSSCANLIYSLLTTDNLGHTAAIYSVFAIVSIK